MQQLRSRESRTEKALGTKKMKTLNKRKFECLECHTTPVGRPGKSC